MTGVEIVGTVETGLEISRVLLIGAGIGIQVLKLDKAERGQGGKTQEMIENEIEN